MEVIIYQMKLNEANHFYCYSSLSMLRRHNLKVEPWRYCKVWEGDFEEDIASIPSTNNIWNLDKIFETFNLNHPKNFRGHSLSVSDVVKLGDDYYFCDDYGWEKITDIWHK